MNITDLLLKYRTPLFDTAGEGGGAGGAGSSDGGGGAVDTVIGGDTSGDGGDQGGGDTDTNDDSGDTDTGDTDESGDNADTNSEGKTKDEDSDEGSKEDNTDQAQADITIAIPEGMEVFKGDFEAVQNEANEWLKENPDATNEQLLGWAAHRQAEKILEQANAEITETNSLIEKWTDELKSDPVFAGDNFEANVALGNLALEKNGDPQVTNLLVKTGLASNPMIVKALAAYAKENFSDTDVIPANGGDASSDDAAVKARYPNSKV